jgi:hypothetical protein
MIANEAIEINKKATEGNYDCKVAIFELIDESGVDYAFLSGFGYKESWKGKVCSGHRNDNGTITWQQPCGCGTYTADESHFKEIKA